jgi:hypothetical protein
MNKNENGKKSKLSLDDFKLKSATTSSKEALNAITGGILAACHDGTTNPPKCTNYQTSSN